VVGAVCEMIAAAPGTSANDGAVNRSTGGRPVRTTKRKSPPTRSPDGSVLKNVKAAHCGPDGVGPRLDFKPR